MAQPVSSSSIPTPTPGPSVIVTPLPDIYRDPVNTAVNNQTIVNTTLPNPSTLDKTSAASSRNLVLKTAKPGDAIQYAFGRTLVRPTVIGADDTGEYLVLDLMWSVGEVQRVCNGIVPSSASPGSWDHSLYFPDSGGLAIISGGLYEHFLGTQGQAASSIMTALKGSYDAYPGIAHSVISMKSGWNLNVVGYVDGVKVIDPRTSPHIVAWTQNPALILADMLVRCGYTMDYTSVADAANYCDELVGAFSPQINRWKISGAVYDRSDLQSWIHTMAQYAHCYVDKSGSTFFLRPDKPRASSHTVTATDMLANSARVKLRGGRNTVNGVRVNYAFATGSLDAEYGTLTDPGTITQLQMPYWSASFPYLGAHAKRHAEEVYRKSQLAVEELEFVSFDEGLNRTVGDVGTITNAAVGLSAKAMTLIDNQQIAPGRWRRRYTEYDASVYQDTSYSLTYNTTELYNPYNPPPGPTPTLDWQYNAASPRQPVLTLSWTGSSWAYIKDYFVRVYSSDSPQVVIYDTNVSGFVDHATGTVSLDLSAIPIQIGTTYTADVYIRSNVNAIGTVPGTASITPEVDFLFTVRTTGASETFTIQCQNVGVFNAVIDWGDAGPTSAITTYNDADLAHVYLVAGDYQIRVSGTFPNIYMNNVAPHDLKIRSVENLGAVGWTRLNHAFNGCNNMTSFNAGYCDTSLVTTMESMFEQCRLMTTANVLTLNTSSVTSFHSMFEDTWAIASLNCSGWNTSSVTNMERTFEACGFDAVNPNINVGGWNTSAVTTMQGMFFVCESLVTVDIAHFNTGLVTDFSFMFQECLALTSVDVSGFNTISATEMDWMFYRCNSLTSLDVSAWNTSSVVWMYGMFEDCTVLASLDVSLWNTSSLTGGDTIFAHCPALTGVEISGWNVAALVDGYHMFNGSDGALTQTEYNATLIAWEAQVVQPNVSIHFGSTVTYSVAASSPTSTASAAKESLMSQGWNIVDGGYSGVTAPVIESHSVNATYAGSVTTHTIAMPSGVVNDDLLVVIACNDSSLGDAGFSIDGTGWTKYFERGDTGTDTHIAVFWKIASGAEATRTVTATNAGVPINFALRISGASLTQPLYYGDTDTRTTDVTSHPLPYGGFLTYDVAYFGAKDLLLYGLSFDGSDGLPFSVTGTNYNAPNEDRSAAAPPSSTGTSACWGYKNGSGGDYGSGGASITSTVADTSACFQLFIRPRTS